MQTTGTAVRVRFGGVLPLPQEKWRPWGRPGAIVHQKADLMTPQDAAALVRAIASGHDRNAFKELYGFYAPRIQTMLLRSGATDEIAEDIAQETLIAVWRKAESYDPERATVSAWMFTIARNLRIDRFRRDKRAQLHNVYELVEPTASPSPDMPLETIELEGRVRAALDELPDEQVRVVNLSFFEGRAHGEIAEKLGIPLGTVKSRLRLAMARLRQYLGDSR